MENNMNGETTSAAWLALKHSWLANISVKTAKIELFAICFGAELDYKAMQKPFVRGA